MPGDDVQIHGRVPYEIELVHPALSCPATGNMVRIPPILTPLGVTVMSPCVARRPGPSHPPCYRGIG